MLQGEKAQVQAWPGKCQPPERTTGLWYVDFVQNNQTIEIEI